MANSLNLNSLFHPRTLRLYLQYLCANILGCHMQLCLAVLQGQTDLLQSLFRGVVGFAQVAEEMAREGDGFRSRVAEAMDVAHRLGASHIGVRIAAGWMTRGTTGRPPTWRC